MKKGRWPANVIHDGSPEVLAEFAKYGESRSTSGPRGGQGFHNCLGRDDRLRLVRLVTPKGGLVIDPFAGSGTTLIAAYREDCRAIGIELDPVYHAMAEHGVDRATAQMRLPL